MAPSLAHRPGRGVISAEALSDAAVACQRLLRRISQDPVRSFKNARRPRLTSVTGHVLAAASFRRILAPGLVAVLPHHRRPKE